MLLKKNNLLLFLILAFLWSWISWLAGLHLLYRQHNQDGFRMFLIFFYLGIYGPSISAILTTMHSGGVKGIMKLFGKIIIWNAPLRIYVTIVFLPALFLLSGIGLLVFISGGAGKVDYHGLFIVPSLLASAVLYGPMGEELGWRGWLLPELQKKYSALISSMIIGVIWFSWHIPLFFAPFGALVSGEPLSVIHLLAYLAFVMCLSCISTWMVNHSGGSVLVAILMHLSMNAGIVLLLFPGLESQYKTIYYLSVPLMIISTLFLIIRTRLVRNPVTGM